MHGSARPAPADDPSKPGLDTPAPEGASLGVPAAYLDAKA